MTTSIQFIDSVAAREHGWHPVQDYTFARKLPALAVQLSELGALVPNLPLAFAQVGDGQFTLVAVTGFVDGHNQLVADDGRWVLQYQPSELQCYPFSLQRLPRAGEGAAAFGVCFNHASGLYREQPDTTAGDQPFFVPDTGAPQPVFQQVTQRLQRHLAQQQATRRAVQALHQAQLLVPWQIPPREGHPGETLPQGLYRVDEDKLKQLQGSALEALHQAHALALAYGQLFSMSRLAVLHRIKDAHAARRLRAGPAAAAASVAGSASAAAPALPPGDSIAHLFEGSRGDTLQFNF